MRRPLLGLAMALGLGALLGPAVSRCTPALAFLIAAAAGLGCLSTVTRRPAYRWLALLAAFTSAGTAARGIEETALDRRPLRSWLADGAGRGPCRLTGLADGDGLEVRGRVRFVVDADGVECPGFGGVGPRGRVRAEIGGDIARTQIGDGDRVAVWVTALRIPRRAKTPGVTSAEEWARRDGLDATAYVKSGALVSVGVSSEAGMVRLTARRVRTWARGRFAAHVLPGEEQALIEAIVLGVRSGIDDDTSEALRIAGTYHILAISGAQVALFAAVLLVMARPLRLDRRVQAFGVTVILAFYTVVVGADPPVVRAAVMASVLLLGRAWDLDGDAANLLGLAGLLMLAHRPSEISDIGFQLSFLATLGLILLTRRFIPVGAQWPLRLELAVASTLAAQAAVLPLLVAQFHRLSPAAPVANLVAAPLAAGILAGGLALLAAAVLIPPLAPRVGDLTWSLAHVLLRSGDPIRDLPWADWRVATPSVAVTLAYGMGLWLWASGRRQTLGAVLAVVGVLGMAVSGAGGARGDGRLHLTVLDVGQGDALVARSPRGRILVVDAGPAGRGRDAGKWVVAPFLWWLGTTRIDALAVTHAHADHTGGVPFLLKAFRVSEGWEGPTPRSDAGYERLERVWRAARVRRRALARGALISWDGVLVRVLAPTPHLPRAWANAESLVLSLEFGGVHFGLAGDANLGAAFAGSDPVDVLKVPHHGARGANPTIDVERLRPRVAIFTLSDAASGTLPDAKVLAAYSQAGSLIQRTNHDGSVDVSTDGVHLWLKSADIPDEYRLR